MDSVNLDAAKHLIACEAIHTATIQSLDGRKWVIMFRGRNNFLLKSERQNPRKFGTLETALRELRELGLTRCEVDFKAWERKARRLPRPSLTALRRQGRPA